MDIGCDDDKGRVIMRQRSTCERSDFAGPVIGRVIREPVGSIRAAVLILPDGQITSDFQKSCQAPKSKIFLFSLDPNQFTDSRHPVPKEGRAHVTNAGRDAMDVGSARGERGLLAYGEVVWF